MPNDYRRYIDGWRAMRLIDPEGNVRGELVWRYASGNNVEITEFGIFDQRDRRRGLGSRLLEAGLQDMTDFAQQIRRPIRLVYLFCETRNEPARAFYEAKGFQLCVELPDFYKEPGGAVMYAVKMGDL
jgi:ribosomal protein S18 acetylase RimI-like enzyme